MKLRLNGHARVRSSGEVGTVVVRAEMADGSFRYGLRFNRDSGVAYYPEHQIYAVGSPRKLTKAQEAALVRCASGPSKVHPATAACLLYAPGGLIQYWDMPTGMYELNQRGRAWILEHRPDVELCDSPETQKDGHA